MMSLLAALALPCAGSDGSPSIEPLTIDGEDFVTDAGEPVRFWGVNLVAVYPTHEEAEALAANLAERQINLVRPHHMLRPSRDWITRSEITALQTYDPDSRTPDDEAWDRFDYLNAQLREHGVYLAFSGHWSRRYRPEDVDIIEADEEDRAAWAAAIEELETWDWRRVIDVRKMLPVVDERAALLEAEFIRQLLTHRNPYTGLTYAEDPQVLTFETINEGSTEYAIINDNRFPDYFHEKLVEQWHAFAEEHGVDGGDIYNPADDEITRLRGRFLRELDRAHFERVREVVREAGSDVAMTYSNLWRGDNALEMHAEHADFIEDHLYANPLVVEDRNDLFHRLTKTQVADMPYFVGELNQSESSAAIERESPYRTMLPLATAAYGSLQNWSGVVWFAWLHGDEELGPDGWAVQEMRRARNIGEMITDGMQIDHLRTTGILFRRHLVDRAEQTLVLHLDEPTITGSYHPLMDGTANIPTGWQNIHAIRRTFGPEGEPHADEAPPSAPPSGEQLISDTGQIVKDMDRQQLIVAAPSAEAFSGLLDEQPVDGFEHLALSDHEGFATVIVVSDDEQPLSQSRRLIISRTGLDEGYAEVDGPRVTIRGLAPESQGQQWHIRPTRPRAASQLLADFTEAEYLPATVNDEGELVLPLAGWHECELHLLPSDTE